MGRRSRQRRVSRYDLRMVSHDESPIRIAAALISRADGRTLLVRKRNAEAFMQAGGKIEAHEAPVAALVRELNEELALVVDPSRLTPLGRRTAPANFAALPA